jgi:gas vesicle protein
MGRFLNGVMVGMGIGLLIAPMRGEEMQHLVRQRYKQLRSNLPEKEQLKQASQQVTAGLSQTASVAKDVAQQAATKVQATGGVLSDLAQQSAQKVKETGQGALDATKQVVQTVKERGQTATTTSQEEPEEVIVFVDDMHLDQGV